MGWKCMSVSDGVIPDRQCLTWASGSDPWWTPRESTPSMVVGVISAMFENRRLPRDVEDPATCDLCVHIRQEWLKWRSQLLELAQGD
jgi:hypothetical protein